MRELPNFNEAGFLSVSVDRYRKQNYIQHSQLFNLVYDLNLYAHALKGKCDVRNKDPQAIIGMCLYFRILNSYASATLLMERGLGHDAEAIARVAIEATFFLKRVVDDESFALDFIKTDHRTRLTLLNTAKDKKSGIYDLFEGDEERLQSLHQELDKYIKKEGIEELKAFQVADKAGMRLFYNYAYRILSQSVHPNPRSLSRYGKFDQNDNLVEFSLAPETEPIPMVLLTCVSMMLFSIKQMETLFKIDESECGKFEDRFQAEDRSYQHRSNATSPNNQPPVPTSSESSKNEKK